jgi:hypothetical protein
LCLPVDKECGAAPSKDKGEHQGDKRTQNPAYEEARIFLPKDLGVKFIVIKHQVSQY